MLKSNSRDEIMIEVTGGTYVFLQFGYDNDTLDGCDSYIDYSIYSSDKEEIDGGNMDYNSEEVNYSTIEDAILDILDFAGYTKGVRYRILSDDEAEEIMY